MSVLNSPVKTFARWLANLGEACLCHVSMERAAKLSPDWARFESRPRNTHPR